MKTIYTNGVSNTTVTKNEESFNMMKYMLGNLANMTVPRGSTTDGP